MAEPGYSIWDTLENAKIRIKWNSTPEFNKLECIWMGQRFLVDITQEQAEFLLNKFACPDIKKMLKLRIKGLKEANLR